MPKILNTLLCSIMIFLLAFMWAYVAIKDVSWSIVCAAILTAAFTYVIWRIADKWDSGKKIKQKRKKDVADLAEHLKFGEDNAQLFAELFRFYGFETDKTDYDSFVATKDGQKNYVAVCFEQDMLSRDRLRECVVTAKRIKADKLYIFANKIGTSEQRTAESYINTAFIDGNNAYELLEQCDKLPTITRRKPKKTSLIAKYALCRQRFGWYFASCIFMIIISVFSFFPWYTLAWATVMFVLAVYSLFNKRYNTKKTQVSLD